ncbi:pilus assembly protein TadG-related protein [Actinocorallia longicatena]|uniref:Putative Flp pilus-assembly TadG-like N-terminal domain-containing protein n=1 Tax=Actinocorallia longicatena TaxID=111803 RepID=A0ABP6QMH5_9ACTN
MPGLMRRLAGDRGSMAPLFAVLLAGGVLLGAAAVVVDVGRVYAEREELQTGADGAAMALAQYCAARPSGNPCAPGGLAAALTDARLVAGRNASDGRADVTFVCGMAGTTSLRADACPARPANATGCVRQRPAAGNYVEVQASSRGTDDRRLLPYSFTQAVTGSPGVTVATCARAGWGASQRVPYAFPFMISECSWKRATADGTEIGPHPENPFRPGRDQNEETVGREAGGCDGDQNIAGLIATNEATCQKNVKVGDTVIGYDAGTVLGAIQGQIDNIVCGFNVLIPWLLDFIGNIFGQATARIVHVPIFKDGPTGGGSVKNYQILGFAPFVLTGGNIGLITTPSYRNLLNWCAFPLDVTHPCLIGYFVHDSLDGPYGGSANYGLTSVGLAG